MHGQDTWRVAHEIRCEQGSYKRRKLPCETIHSEEGNTTGGADVVLPAPIVTDVVDPSPVATCNYLIGAPILFPLGDSLVTCYATDASSNQSDSTSYTVTVVDTTPPIVTVPADLSFEGNTTGGANVTLPDATATDIVDDSLSVVCSHESGFFELGDTEVSHIDQSGTVVNDKTHRYPVAWIKHWDPPRLILVIGPFCKRQCRTSYCFFHE